MRKTFPPVCGFSLWQPQVLSRISKAARAAGGVSCEKITSILRSKPIDRLVDHQCRILVDKLANGFPTKAPVMNSFQFHLSVVIDFLFSFVGFLLTDFRLQIFVTAAQKAAFIDWGTVDKEYTMKWKMLEAGGARKGRILENYAVETAACLNC